MTALTTQQGRYLAAFVNTLRPEWDEAGIRVAIERCANQRAANVALALIRLAEDPNVRTPGALPNPDGPHWVERRLMSDVANGGHVHPAKVYGLHEGDPREICIVCSLDHATCAGRSKTSGHEFRARTATNRTPSTVVPVRVGDLRTGLRRPDERCGCGRLDCNDHHQVAR